MERPDPREGEDSTDRGRRNRAGEDESTQAVELAGPDDAEGHAYLLVFERESAAMFRLPALGEVTIGRGENADLRLLDSSVSRAHARISMASGEARIVDLDSQNGTIVNGERIVGTRRLVTGDTIGICAISLVFHAKVRPSPSAFRQILPFEQLRRRTEEEIERALRYQRPLTLLIALVPLDGSGRSRVAQSVAASLRLMDVVGWGVGDQVFFLMPETDADVAPDVAARVLGLLQRLIPTAKVGYATCPQDGCDVETLLISAREAASAAPPGEVAAAAHTFHAMTVGDRKVIVADPAMSRLFALLERLAAADLPILVCGETGTGKEVAATAVHHWSARSKHPLVAFNCAALQENLVESELFGHEKGAFSGAVAAKVGLLEAASGGTVFLDEIGEMSPATQAKLLRVLETKKVIRLGDVREREIDIRLVAATNRNLAEEVKAGRFRQDLFFRLGAATVWLPPLRDRRRELPILAQSFLADACTRTARPSMTISDEAMQQLATYGWPGNIRELRNVMDYVAAAYADRVLLPRHLASLLAGGVSPHPAPTRPAPEEPEPSAEQTQPLKFRPIDEELRELERARMIEALAAAGGNQTRAAELINMPLRTFQAKVKLYDIPRPSQKGR